jgi:hypothetical protein
LRAQQCTAASWVIILTVESAPAWPPPACTCQPTPARKTAELGGCRFTGRCLWAGWRRAAYTNVDAARRMRGGFSASLRPRVHTVQDAPLHHPRCSSVAVHRHLGARGISCIELHRAPRCRQPQTSLHRHRRCERPAHRASPLLAPAVQGCTCEVHVVPLLVSIKG